MFPEHIEREVLPEPGSSDKINLEEGELIEEANKPHHREVELKLLVSQIVPEVVQELEATLRSICVPERVLAAEKSAQDWKRMAEMAVRKPEMFTNSLVKRDETHPVFLPLNEFLLHPMAAPLWRLQTRLNLAEDDINFKKWWKRIHSDPKFSPQQKVSRYLEMINMFIAAGDRFWPIMATNPTYLSIQRISSELAAMSGWLKASALELHSVVDAFVAASNDVAQGTQKVSEVRFAIRHLWPAGYQPEGLHFDGDPYINANLYEREDDTQCLVSPQFRVFAFNAGERWQDTQNHFAKRQKLTTPTHYARRQLDTNNLHAPKIPFSTMINRT